MDNVSFLNPIILTFLIIIPILLYRSWSINQHSISFLISNIDQIKAGKITYKKLYILSVLRIVCIALLIIAIARPVKTEIVEKIIPQKQSAFMLAVDVSKSMLAEDLKPNRLDALKKIASDFIDKRPNDLIGLTIYAGESFTQCPLTTDHELLKSLLREVNDSWLPDKTAIGHGLATAINRLKDIKSDHKIIILLTDGENNTGIISPLSVTPLAKDNQIKVYTIGIGTNGEAPYPDFRNNGKKIMVPVSIDENLLKQIAGSTNGKYYRATNNSELEKIYDQIDTLELENKQINYYKSNTDLFPYLIMFSITILITEQILKHTILKSFTH